MPGFRGSGGHRGGRGDRGEDGAAAGLTGGGPSQLGVNGSMRARDVSRPSAVDVAAAEKLVQVSYRPRSKPHGTPLHSDGLQSDRLQSDGSDGSSRVSS